MHLLGREGVFPVWSQVWELDIHNLDKSSLQPKFEHKGMEITLIQSVRAPAEFCHAVLILMYGFEKQEKKTVLNTMNIYSCIEMTFSLFPII